MSRNVAEREARDVGTREMLMDVTELTSLYNAPGPFATVYASTATAGRRSAEFYALSWKDILNELGRLGVDPGSREKLAAAAGDPWAGGTRVVVAAGVTVDGHGHRGEAGSIRYASWLAGRSDVDLVQLGALPHLLPVISRAQSRIPHVVALVDRLGADVLAFADPTDPAVSDTAAATRPPWHKARAGGWAERRFQRRVEEHWREGAKAHAELLASVVADIRARALIMAGDPTAVALIRDRLPAEIATMVVLVPGGRALDGSAAHLASHVLDVLDEQERRETAGLLADFAQYRGRAMAVQGAARSREPGGLDAAAQRDAAGGAPETAVKAADGPAATVAALRQGQVATLLLSAALDEEAQAAFGPGFTDIAVDENELRELGIRAPQRGTLVDTLVRSALGTGATVRRVPADIPPSPTAGVGALLRYNRHPG
jgi:hypothetical protein